MRLLEWTTCGTNILSDDIYVVLRIMGEPRQDKIGHRTKRFTRLPSSSVTADEETDENIGGATPGVLFSIKAGS